MGAICRKLLRGCKKWEHVSAYIFLICGEIQIRKEIKGIIVEKMEKINLQLADESSTIINGRERST